MNYYPATSSKGYVCAALVIALWIVGPYLADTLASVVWRLM